MELSNDTVKVSPGIVLSEDSHCLLPANCPPTIPSSRLKGALTMNVNTRYVFALKSRCHPQIE